MSFEDYLKAKRIDASRYKRAESSQYEGFEKLFLQMHPDSFTAQKLFLINGIRRRFPLKEEAKTTERKVQARPRIVPKPKKKD